jgi:transposase
VLGDNPLGGAVYVFRNRSGTAIKILCYDGQGFWLCMKRFSQGCLSWWPKTGVTRVSLSARELMIVLWNGNPEQAQMAQDWRRVA